MPTPETAIRTRPVPARMAGPDRRGAFTIASRGRLRAALALANSYLQHHPDHEFYVIALTDAPEPAPGWKGLHMLDFREIRVPDSHTFHYQYAIGDLCVALKPFAFQHLQQDASADTLLYLDPDTLVFAPMDAAWAALASHELLLTPRMRSPDPTQVGVPTNAPPCHGLYHPGLVGMGRGRSSEELLAWWCERVRTDCILDPAHGLALDWRLLDPVPLYFDRVGILEHPAHGVGHWNLHERQLSLAGEQVLVDGHPLACFHFNGYEPEDPEYLVPGQPHHRLSDSPALAEACGAYARALAEAPSAPAGGDELCLPNGIPASRALNRVVLDCVRRGVSLPSPGLASDAFCEFATHPDPLLHGQWVAPVVRALLDLRPDLAAAFPEAGCNKEDPAFGEWLRRHGGCEERLEALLDRWGHNLQRDDGVTIARRLYRGRADLQQAYPHLLSDPRQYRRFGEWLAGEARQEGWIDEAGLRDYQAGAGGFGRVLDCYFSDLGLLARFPLLHTDAAIQALVTHLSAQLPGWPRIDGIDLAVFAHAARDCPLDLLLACLRYNPVVREAIGGIPSAFRLDRIEDHLEQAGVDPALTAQLASTLLQGDWIRPGAQYASFVETSADVAQVFPALARGQAAVERKHYALDRHGGRAAARPGWTRFARILLQEPDGPPGHTGINLCGPMHDATGVGESARALQRVMAAAGIAHAVAVVPSRFPGTGEGDELPARARYGSFDERHPVNLVVATADSRPHMDFWIPDHIPRGRINLGYWVWETEVLPPRWRDAARGLDALLTPSAYSARAIAATVHVPVHVVPIAPDFAALERAAAARGHFGLDDGQLLFGFFFDVKSILERKNPAAVIEAFRRAFGARTDVGLVLKVNSPAASHHGYARLREQAAGLNVTWIEPTLSATDTSDLMASLDVYVSLHRSEGFGLTMAEAMALGKPVVATGYSGNLDFMDRDSALLVDHVVVASARAHGPYPAGSRWAEPDIAHAARLLASLEDGALRQRLGSTARRRVHQTLSPERIAAALTAHLASTADQCRVQPDRNGAVG